MTAILDPRPDPSDLPDPDDRATAGPAPRVRPPLPAAVLPATGPLLAAALRRRSTATTVRAYGVAMFGLFAVAIAVQPASDVPAAWWAVVLSELAWYGMFAVLVGSLLGRRWAAPAGLASAATFLGLSLACPVSGHHDYAAWWGIQLAAGAAMVVLSAAVRGRTHPR